MAKASDYNPNLAPYIFYGLTFKNRETGNVVTDCPWCSKAKFSISAENGMWRCLHCNEGSSQGKSIHKGGNAITFIRLLHEKSPVPLDSLQSLSKERGLRVDTLKAWGVRKSKITGEFLIPAGSIENGMTNLYRYALVGGTRKLLSGPKPAFAPAMFGYHLWSKSKSKVYVCEGPWDGMALYDTLLHTMIGESGEAGFCSPENAKQSLYNSANIICVPGCNIFPTEFAQSLNKSMSVHIMYDNDHPKLVDGKTLPPASEVGVRTAINALTLAKYPTEQISYLKWGVNGYDPKLPSGTDLRDFIIKQNASLGHRRKALMHLMGLISPPKSEWLLEPARASEEGKTITLLKCESWKDLTTAWRKALKWTDGLDYALSAMLASVASVRLVGDQLWLKVIGPASCGKSTLCEALSVNSQYVLAKSTMRGFHSGYGDSEEDCSLVNQVRDKTFITKDGDTLLQSPNLGQILSEGRDLYDTVSRTSYRNKASRDYVGVRMTWLLCGTSSLRSIDQSELGERFLDVVIMEGIDDDLEDEILVRVANRVSNNLKREVGENSEVQQDPAMTVAMGLTGGYVNFLRENVVSLMNQLEVSAESLHKCTRLGKFVAFMRARPSSRQDETAEREFAPRLVSQHIRLAQCLAVVMNRKTLDEAVMERVRKTSFDTARGKTLEICRHLYGEEEGLETRSLAMLLSTSEADVKTLLRFLKRIGVVEVKMKKSSRGYNPKPAWFLTQRLRKLWTEVHEGT